MRAWTGWLVALLLSTTMAGCLSEDGPDTDTQVETTVTRERVLPDELVTPTLLPAVLLGQGPGEPNVAVAPDGTIYVTSIRELFRSTDHGATFEQVGAGELQGGGDGDITIDVTGRVHWLGLFGPDAPIPYQYSDDQGETWTDHVDISNDTGSDREWIASRQDSRTVYSAWRDSDDNGIVAFRTSFDGGETWEDRVTLSDDAIGGPIAVGPVDGEVFQAQATFESGTGAGDAGIRLGRSYDHGATWEVVPVITVPQSVQFGLIGFPFSIFPALDADEAGNLYLVYAVDSQALPASTPKPAARFGVYLQTSTDDGDTWTDPVLLSDPDHAAIMPWVAAGAPGRIAVSWYENTAGNPHDNLPDAWNVKLLEGIHMNETTGGETVTVQLNDMPVHIGSICTSGTGCLLTGGDRTLLDFFEVALQPNGHPVVTWAASTVPYAGSVQDIDVYARAVENGTMLR